LPAHDTAIEAVARMRLERPNWTIRAEALVGDPALRRVQKADEWGADCVFVGSRAFTSEYERWRLGSVSTALAESAPCSVEVVRPRDADRQAAG
jgi:nucleotide-binding universal stress UspA family protein